jgi:hypothetical protein
MTPRKLFRDLPRDRPVVVGQMLSWLLGVRDGRGTENPRIILGRSHSARLSCLGCCRMRGPSGEATDVGALGFGSKGGMVTWLLDGSGSCDWIFVTSPSEWLVVPYVAKRTSSGIAIQQREVELPLVKSILEDKVVRPLVDTCTCCMTPPHCLNPDDAGQC